MKVLKNLKDLVKGNKLNLSYTQITQIEGLVRCKKCFVIREVTLECPKNMK